ncbi:MAG TPA: M48 family metallopeptidase [Candidatus Acidoferrum sp.]|nr:M48 family metallopeptidase [Candidatus Acidoferrum sp.]
MDFFERQAQAHRHTKLLVVYFACGVTLLILAVYAAVLVLFTGVSASHSRRSAEAPAIALWQPQLFFGVAVGTLAVIAIGSGFKTLELAQGGRAVATSLGGRLVDPNTDDPDERKLLNVVEEMAIAAGLPVPQVYILPEEKGINAFAAGHSPSDAVVTVTEGSVRLLTRDELQGVIGHEFSHILNGDMRLNLRLMGIIFGIVCLAVIGRVLLYARSGRSRDKNALPLLGLALIVIGWVGVLFGRLIQAAVSRQREFLADASSVQFTRNPAGLAGALKKIGGLSYGSRLETAHAEEASHMFFGNGMGESFFHLMDTHPPLAERIRAIDPSFDGSFPAVDETAVEEQPPAVSAGARPMPFPPLLPGMGRGQAGAAGVAAPFIAAQALTPHTGNPTTAHLEYAAQLRGAIPAPLQAAAHESLGACTLVYALLLSDDDDVRARQLDGLAQATSPAVCQETMRIWPQVEVIAAQAKLPLVDLALPGLRHLSAAQFQQFRAAVQKLVEADGEINLFEYVLQKIVLRHLEPSFLPARKPIIQYYSLKPLMPDCAVLLSALAYVGSEELEKVQFAFRRGAQALGPELQPALTLVPQDACDLEQVDAALNRLSLAVPQIKKNALDACVQTVAADGVIEESEAELLRAIADTLDCPMPPFMAGPQ